MVEALHLAGMIALMPAGIALALSWLLLRSGRQSLVRFACALPVAAAFLIAYALHPDRLPLTPERHWQWLPYLALGAALVGGALANAGVSAIERALAMVVIFVVAAWQLVPLWDTLQPPRTWLIPLVAVYLWLVGFVPSLLPARLRGRALLFNLAGVMLATASYVTIEVSLKIGLALVPAAAALGGAWLATLLTKSPAGDAVSPAVVGLLPVFAILAGGGAFVGAIELPEPRWLLLAIPAAPLMLWLFACGPLAKLQGTTAAVAQVLAVALIPIAIVAWTVLKTEPEVEWSKLARSRPASLLNLGNRPEVEPVIGGNLAGLGPLE